MPSRAERAEVAVRLRAEGWTARQIAEHLGISRSYAASLCTDPTGDQDRARKWSYGGKCENCGNPTYGGEGKSKSPRFCAACAPDAYRKWTRERVIRSIQEWARRRGEAPTATEWAHGNVIDADGYEFPCLSSVYWNGGRKDRKKAAFLSWADAIEAAGFPRPSKSRNYNKTPWEVENMSPRSTLTRDYVVFTVEEDGTYRLYKEVEAQDSARAIEIAADTPGKYASVARASITEYRVASRLVATPDRNGAPIESEGAA